MRRGGSRRGRRPAAAARAPCARRGGRPKSTCGLGLSHGELGLRAPRSAGSGLGNTQASVEFQESEGRGGGPGGSVWLTFAAWRCCVGMCWRRRRPGGRTGCGRRPRRSSPAPRGPAWGQQARGGVGDETRVQVCHASEARASALLVAPLLLTPCPRQDSDHKLTLLNPWPGSKGSLWLASGTPGTCPVVRKVRSASPSLRPQPTTRTSEAHKKVRLEEGAATRRRWPAPLPPPRGRTETRRI